MRAELEAQPRMEPGTEGWWQVWGACVRDIRPGDAVAFAHDGVTEWHYVEDTFVAKNAPIRWGIVEDGERYTLGAFTPIALLRRGTHHTLAASVR
jgi:hypothetical protein